MSAGRAPAPTVQLTCRTCNVVFTRLRRNVIPGRGGYCSHACAGVHQPRADAVTKTCQRCGTSFGIKAHRLRQGKGTFCSNACRRKPLPSAAVVAPEKPKRPVAKPRPTSITPKYLDRLPEIDGGSHVSCHRCERIRERGVRCVCERYEP